MITSCVGIFEITKPRSISFADFQLQPSPSHNYIKYTIIRYYVWRKLSTHQSIFLHTLYIIYIVIIIIIILRIIFRIHIRTQSYSIYLDTSPIIVVYNIITVL